MDSMDNLRERLEALEQQTEQLQHHARTVARRLRWWRGMACGVVLLSLLSLALPSSKAADGPARGMAERMATLEKKLRAMAFDDAANEVVITGANLRIVNGLGGTQTTNGLGNLIVGYNEERPDAGNVRTGSHNVVVGIFHTFSSFGGLVVGINNEISADFASVSAGVGNVASGSRSSVSGGFGNRASAFTASISGGFESIASGDFSSVSGGDINAARGVASSVNGGSGNTASGNQSSVSGGEGNTASGFRASVSGGENNTASGDFSSVSGGFANTAMGLWSSVSGGNSRTASGEFDWVAGPLFADF